MSAKQPSPEAPPSAPADRMDLSGYHFVIIPMCIFYGLHWALLFINGRLLYLTVSDVGLLPDSTVEELLDIPLFELSNLVCLASLALFFLYTSVFLANHYDDKFKKLYQIGLFLALLFTGGILCSPLGFPNQLKTGLESGITKGMLSFNLSHPNASKAYALQMTQVKYDCCGWKGPQDYLAILKDGGRIPLSCCQNDGFTLASPFTTCKMADVTRPGCFFSDLNKYPDYLVADFFNQLLYLIILLPLTFMKRILAKDNNEDGLKNV